MIIFDKLKLKKIISAAKKKGKKVLIKKGVFDIIHPGHVYAINQFTKVADIIIILIQSDEFTRLKKGPSRPINSQQQRRAVIDGLKGVDYVYSDKSMSREEYIKLLNYLAPDIIAVTASDSKKTSAYTSKKWRLIQFPDKKKKGYSTTEIINRVLSKEKQIM